MGIFSKLFSRSHPTSSTTRPGPKVSDFLTRKTIAIFPAGPSKQQVLGKLIGSLDLSDPTAALKAILAREETGTTIIVPGFGLPHARVHGISKIMVALGVSSTGVIDPRSQKPIYAFLLFLTPADNMKEHLAFLSNISALLQSDGFVEGLTSKSDGEQVLGYIREAEAKL
jgi:mannitol/fructose-specific phosphotransferase system IIA component (Ntr-type)